MDITAFFSQWPREVWAAVVAIVGWLLALFLRWGATTLLTWVWFDRLAARVGFSAFLKTGQVPYTPSRLVGIFLFWITLLATLVGVSVLLDFALVTSVSHRLAEMAPGLLAAVLVVIIGFILVSFLANVVLTLARNAAWTHARLVSRAARVLGIIVVVGVASEQLGLNLTLLHSLLLILAGGIAFGCALAFGLGGQELAKQTLRSWAEALSERDRPKGPDLEG